MTRCFRFFATALVLALLLAGSAHALPRERSAPAGPARWIERVQEWLGSLWTPRSLSQTWEEEGVIMDPNGRDSAPPQGPGADAGVTMDTNG